MPRVRRKYDNIPPTLEEGPPALKRFGLSETGPSIPKDKDHAKVHKVVVKEFGLLGDKTFEEIREYRTRFDVQNGIPSYITENDVAKLVERFLSNILDAMAPRHSWCSQPSRNLRIAARCITLGSTPVDVVEVKKPDKPGQSFLALEHPNVLGELYDFVNHLPNYYGIFPAFGILTNMNSWRVAWFPDEETNELAAAPEELEDPDDNSEPDSLDHTVEPHKLLEELPKPEDAMFQSVDEDTSQRTLHVSRIFNREKRVEFWLVPLRLFC